MANHLAGASPAPTCCSTPATRWTGIPGVQEALARARDEDKPIFLSIGYSACHWCHVMERESFDDEADRGLPERPLRQHQGRPGGAARPRRHLHAGGHDAHRAGRLAAQRVAHSGRRSRSTAAPTSPRLPLRHALLPPGARGHRRQPGGHPARDLQSTAAACGSILSGWARRARRTEARSTVVQPAGRGRWRLATGRRSLIGLPPTSTAVQRRLGRRAQVPAAAGAGVPLAQQSLDTKPELQVRSSHPGRHGRGRHLRPPGRRLPSLLHRRLLAGAPLREDALRQRPARPLLPARLAATGQAPLPRRRRGDPRLPPARDAPSPGRLLQRRGRRFRRGRGRLLRLDARSDTGGPHRRGSAARRTTYG